MTDVKERPILFSAPMVRAILSDAKTQTRRVVSARHDSYTVPVSCPYGSPGDVLWVRETWGLFDREAIGGEKGYGVAWRATHPSLDDGAEWIDGPVDYPATIKASEKWRPSIHMPRWVCRLRLRVTSMRIERLHDISEADAMAEGVTPYTTHTLRMTDPDATGPLYRPAFEDLWDSINGKRFPWASNPRVWVVGFERIGGEP